MSDLLKIVISALLTLIGVLSGLAFGYYKWKIERQEKRSSEYFSKRREVYQVFFDKLEDAHVKMRLSDMDEEDFTLFVIDVNSHLLRSAVYMDREDTELANKYLTNLFHLKQKIQNSNNEQRKRNWQQTIVIVYDRDADAYEAKVEYSRQQIINKVRHILKT